jgi:hypothetical protein
MKIIGGNGCLSLGHHHTCRWRLKGLGFTDACLCHCFLKSSSVFLAFLSVLYSCVSSLSCSMISYHIWNLYNTIVRNSFRFRSIVESIVWCYLWATVIVSQMVGVGSFQEGWIISPLSCHLNKLLQFSQPTLITVCVSSARFIFTMLYPSQNCEECCSFLRWAILLACAIYWRSQPALWLFELAWANLFVLHGHAVYFPTVQVRMKNCASVNGRESNGGILLFSSGTFCVEYWPGSTHYKLSVWDLV